ncbi:MAG TPA: hypothetical protein VKT77_18020 [Chthonomonadaceae bacterium]|nr:hypothetical protein [Chthonomonadaceae bacterium]
MATFQDKVVGVRKGHLLATSFHPELTDSDDLHALFVEMTAASQEKR